MKSFFFALPIVALALTACQTADQNAVAGAAGGALVGAAVSNRDDRLTGALVGAAVGVAASTLIGPAPQRGQCYYRDANGQRFIDRC
ncbi:MAG: glycine zipper 2TM domain-containing protein [Gemmobacter sp.]